MASFHIYKFMDVQIVCNNIMRTCMMVACNLVTRDRLLYIFYFLFSIFNEDTDSYAVHCYCKYVLLHYQMFLEITKSLWLVILYKSRQCSVCYQSLSVSQLSVKLLKEA